MQKISNLDAKSHGGIAIFCGGAATVFKSYKIKMVNKSVAEYELSVLSDATSLHNLHLHISI